MINSNMRANLPQNAANTLIAMGSNQNSIFGDAKSTLVAAGKNLVTAGVLIRFESEIYRTPAFPASSGPDFANAVVAADFEGSPADLLKVLHSIEADFGRERKTRWAPRVLDLDLIAMGETVLPSKQTVTRWMQLPPELQSQTAPRELILPHPRMQDRAFVLLPLMDVAPDWVHPVLGQTVREMYEALPKYLLEDIQRYE